MRRFLLAVVASMGLAQTGCYYGHLAAGQTRLLWARQPLDDAIADPEVDAHRRALLEVVPAVRAFARTLGLEVGDQYTSYVDWPGDRLVTTLVRTAPDSLEVVPYWFPIVGHLPYKGYFDQARAEAEAERMRRDQGYDVCVSGVAAYSTLGWMDDPVTAPMLARGAANLVETLFHELVHATAFLEGDADFNESVAQFIGQRAAIRFFESQGPLTDLDWPTAGRVRASIADREKIALATLAFRDRVEAIEGDTNRAQLRESAESEARLNLAALPLEVYDPARVAEKARLSDACLALRGTYIADGPRHAAVLAALDGRLEEMIARLATLAEEGGSAESFFDVSQSASRHTNAALARTEEMHR